MALPMTIGIGGIVSFAFLMFVGAGAFWGLLLAGCVGIGYAVGWWLTGVWEEECK